MEPNLQAIHIDKRFPGVNALTDVSIDFYPGEVHALLGENGAGKSTLIKILSGVYTPTSGKVVFEGNEMHFTAPGEALNKGIEVIHQELSIANDLTVAENVFLGAEPRINNGPLLDRAKMNRDTQALLDYMKVTNIKATDIARDLTAAQQQMVEIAKVISKKAKVVIMDEPTSSLSEHEINALFEQLDNLRNNQVTVIYISHRMAEIFRMCDRATILRDGCKVKTCMIKDTTESEIVNSMVGREIKDYYNRQAHTPGKEMLRVEGLTRKKEFKDISFTAYAGEILGFYGLVGAGRTEVMETIFGARRADAGKIFVEGKQVHFRSPKDAIEHNLGMVTEDRRRTGLMLQATLRSNIVLPSLPYHHRRFGFLDNKWETDIAQEMTQKLRVKTPSIQTIIANLSGGNQQKVILAKWLIANSKILILDEPTRGIDVNAKSEFYALMNDFVADGGCIIMVSSELPEMLGVADRIIVMREGVQGGEISGADATEQSVIQLASVQSNV